MSNKSSSIAARSNQTISGSRRCNNPTKTISNKKQKTGLDFSRWAMPSSPGVPYSSSSPPSLPPSLTPENAVRRPTDDCVSPEWATLTSSFDNVSLHNRFTQTGDLKRCSIAPAPRKFPPGINSLHDLPCEILTLIIDFCIVDNHPVVDPSVKDSNDYLRRGLCDCTNETGDSHGYIPKEKMWLEKHNSSTLRAMATIREMNDWKPKTPIVSSGIDINILVTSKLCYQIGVKALWEKNIFMFTSPTTSWCFSSNFAEQIHRVRKVILPVTVSQNDAIAQCHMQRFLHVQEHPHGPWYSNAAAQPSWFGCLYSRATSKPGRVYTEAMFPNLESLTYHFSKWKQMEAINIKGTPSKVATPFSNEHGYLVTDNPHWEDMELETRISVPVRMVQNFKPWIGLVGLLKEGWVAKTTILSGIEEAAEFKQLQALVDAYTYDWQAVRKLRDLRLAQNKDQ